MYICANECESIFQNFKKDIHIYIYIYISYIYIYIYIHIYIYKFAYRYVCAHTHTVKGRHSHNQFATKVLPTINHRLILSMLFLFSACHDEPATHYNTLQHTSISAKLTPFFTPCSNTYTYIHQYIQISQSATHRNTLQHTATHCNTLPHTATHFYHSNFGSFLHAMLSVFQLLTGDSYTIILYAGLSSQDSIYSRACVGIFVLVWFFMAQLLINNLFVAVIIENFQVSRTMANTRQPGYWARLRGTAHTSWTKVGVAVCGSMLLCDALCCGVLRCAG